MKKFKKEKETFIKWLKYNGYIIIDEDSTLPGLWNNYKDSYFEEKKEKKFFFTKH